MQDKFLNHINQNFSFLQNQKVILACSGGVDSVVLCHLLIKTKIDVALAHCNFGLRKNESEQDALFVESIAKKFNLNYFQKNFDTTSYASSKGISIQMAARELRYNWFVELSEKHNINYIATAHHKDDNFETFLINLSRGSGLKGLIGIPQVNNIYIRPLLAFSKDEIFAFAQEHKLSWREDSSNATDKYLRNALRLEVLPNWKRIEPQLLNRFEQTQSNLSKQHDLLNDYISMVWKAISTKTPTGYKICLSTLKTFPNLEALVFELFAPYGFTETTSIVELIEAQSGKKHYSQSHILLKDRDFFILEEMNTKSDSKEFSIAANTQKIDDPIALILEPVSQLSQAKNNTIYVDRDTIQFPLTLRHWNKGDFFYPQGMKGKKKLSKYFKDEKLSLLDKNRVWLLCSKNDIVWVVGKRADQRFMANNKSTSILKIELK